MTTIIVHCPASIRSPLLPTAGFSVDGAGFCAVSRRRWSSATKTSVDQKGTMKLLASLPTYRADIIVGLKEGYTGPVHRHNEVRGICQSFCDEVGLCVEVLKGSCVYTKGSEPCARISLINYPRFPKSEAEVLSFAEELGLRLAKKFKQLRFTIVASDITRLYEVAQ